MKRYLAVFLILAIVISIPMFVSASSTDLPEKYKYPDGCFTTRDDFVFGFNTHHSGVNCYPAEYLEEQIHLVAKAGCKILRIDEGVPANGDWTYLDTVVGLCNKYGLQIVLVSNPDKTQGEDYITLYWETLARRYNGEDGRGFIDYFQCWNEMDLPLMSAKLGGGASAGTDYNSYFTIRVNGMANLPDYTDCLKAAKAGIRKGNSKSKFMINFCMTHYGIIKWFIEHDAAPDIIGWDWYSKDDDYDDSEDEFRKYINLIYNDIVKDTGIPVMICETNTCMSGIADRNNTNLEEYAQFIANMKIAYETDWIKGLIVYELLDEANRTSAYEMMYGFVECQTGGRIGDPKPIYYEYQRLIGGKSTNNIRMIDRSEIDLTPYEKLIVGTADDSPVKTETAGSTDTIPVSDIEIPEEPPFSFDEEIIDHDDGELLEDDSIIFETEPETVIKNQNIKRKSYKMPWMLLIISSLALIVIAGGTVFGYVFISKRKQKRIDFCRKFS